jgi:hypothetical protein
MSVPAGSGRPGDPRPDEPDWVLNEAGLMMATRSFLLRRGYCCGNGCRNCPYIGTPLDRYPGPQRRRPDSGLE